MALRICAVLLALLVHAVSSDSSPEEYFPGIYFRWDLAFDPVTFSANVPVQVSSFNLTTGVNHTTTASLANNDLDPFNSVTPVLEVLEAAQSRYYLIVDAHRNVTKVDERHIFTFSYSPSGLPSLLQHCKYATAPTPPPPCAFPDGNGNLYGLVNMNGVLKWFQFDTTTTDGDCQNLAFLPEMPDLLHDDSTCSFIVNGTSTKAYYVSSKGNLVSIDVAQRQPTIHSFSDNRLDLTKAGTLNLFQDELTGEIVLAFFPVAESSMLVLLQRPVTTIVEWRPLRMWPDGGYSPHLDWRKLNLDSVLYGENVIIYFNAQNQVMGFDFEGFGKVFTINSNGLTKVCTGSQCRSGIGRYDPTAKYPIIIPPTPPKPPPPSPPSGDSLGFGGVFFILLSVGSVLYLGGGIGYNKFKNREEKSILVLLPHRAFWADLPGLVKDGVMFAVSFAKRDGSSGESNGHSGPRSVSAQPNSAAVSSSPSPAMWHGATSGVDLFAPASNGDAQQPIAGNGATAGAYGTLS